MASDVENDPLGPFGRQYLAVLAADAPAAARHERGLVVESEIQDSGEKLPGSIKTIAPVMTGRLWRFGRFGGGHTGAVAARERHGGDGSGCGGGCGGGSGAREHAEGVRLARGMSTAANDRRE